MDWLYQGLIINLVWIICLFFYSLIKDAPTNNKKDEDMYQIKLNFHVYLFSLVSVSSISFFSITLYFKDKEYLQALFSVFCIFWVYYLTANEFNKVFKMATSKNKKLNNKQKRSKNKSS